MKSPLKSNWFWALSLVVIFFIAAMAFDSYDQKLNNEYKKAALEKGVTLAEQSDVAKPYVLYIKNDNAAVRSCASTECEIVGTYNKGQVFNDHMIDPWIELPEWVEFTTDDRPSSTTKMEYIHKSNLTETK